MVTVRFDHVSKVYRLGRRRGSTLKEFLLKGVRKKSVRDFHALDDVSFSVGEKEILGLVGDNGSGKSTILKIAAGITQATSGTVQIQGRVSALLEVGAGFHPEMTGRENVFLSGTILGISDSELKKRYEQIVEFADLDEFMETPVKFYSSGMYLRLGFAIAMNVNPDVLLVDEILAVGDNIFQERCKRQIKRFRDEGKTILFVSHDLLAVRQFCTRVIYLDHGKIITDAEPETAVFDYMKHVEDGRRRNQEPEKAARRYLYTRDGTQEVSIEEFRILDGEDRVRDRFEVCEPMVFEARFRNRECHRRLTFNLTIYDMHRRGVFCMSSRADGLELANLPQSGTIRLRIPELTLMPGVYTLCIGIFDHDVDWEDPNVRDHVLDLYNFQHSFMVKNSPRLWDLGGYSYLHREWRLEADGKILGEISR